VRYAPANGRLAKGPRHPTTSIRGNVFGMTGMAIAVLTTGALIWKLANGNPAGLGYVLVARVVGGDLGPTWPTRSR